MTRALRYAMRLAPRERADDALRPPAVSAPGDAATPAPVVPRPCSEQPRARRVEGPLPGRHDEDLRLVRRCQETDGEAAFDEIVRRYERDVFRLALSVLGPGADAEAEDVAQEVFLRAYRQMGTYRGMSRLGTWLYRITFNLAVDRRRLARWSKPHIGEEAVQAAANETTRRDPCALAADVERERLVGAILDRLPDAARTVLHLHYWLGSSVDEIAELLRMPAGSVKSWLHRGRRMVGADLRARGIDDAI